MGITEWIDYTQKHKPQGNALSGGVFILLISGLQIGWLFNRDFQKFPWTEGRSSVFVCMTYITFYLTAIFGVYVASGIINRLSKNNIYFTAMTFVSVGTVWFIVVPNNIYLVLIARAMIGFGHGYIYMVVIVHASEIMTQKLRGMIVATMNFVIISSMMLSGTYTMAFEQEADGIGSMRVMGITGAIYSVMGFIFIPLLTRESPVSFIRQKKYDVAVNLMCRVRCESSETWTIRNEYNELKAMVEEDEQTSKNIFQDGNIRPLMLMILMKVGFVVSFNYGLNMIRLKYATSFIGEVDSSVLILLSVRMCTALISLFTIDSRGRKIHFVVSYAGTAITMIIFGAILAFKNESSELGWLFGLLLVIYELFSGFGMGMISDVYLSEAFDTIKKPKSISLVMIIEMSLQVIVLAVTFNHRSSSITYDWVYMIISGILIGAITILLRKELPETAKMSIRQSRNEFLKSGEIVFSGSKMPSQSITFD